MCVCKIVHTVQCRSSASFTNLIRVCAVLGPGTRLCMGRGIIFKHENGIISQHEYRIKFKHENGSKSNNSSQPRKMDLSWYINLLDVCVSLQYQHGREAPGSQSLIFFAFDLPVDCTYACRWWKLKWEGMTQREEMHQWRYTFCR